MRRKRAIAIAAAGLAVAAGGGGAIAATSDGARERDQAVLEDAARRLGVTPQRLRDALGAAQDAQLDAAVRAGELTREQADAIKARRDRAGLVLGGGPGRGGLGHHHHRGFGVFGAGEEVLDAAAEAVGLARAELLERFREGATLGEIAQAENKDFADVRAAIRTAAKAQLDAAVQDNRLTQAQADRLLEEIVERAEDFPGGRGFGHHGFEHRGFGVGGAVFDAAAAALGLERDALLDRLRDGDTLAEIARAEGRRIADVRTAIRAAARADLDEAVQDGRLTQEQADRLLDRIVEGVERLPRFPGPRRP